jgi:hypothetical protein
MLPLYIFFHIPFSDSSYTVSNISRFDRKPEFFVYIAFIGNTEIIILLLFNVVPF